jgi:hypothetical protein
MIVASAYRAAAIGLWIATGAAALAGAGPGWSEIAWPFPRDAWPEGRAFRCAGCGQDLVLYVRPKLGFCNCTTGVTEDAEVDGVTDLDLLAADYVPLGPGTPRRVGDLAGRSRAYALAPARGRSRYGAGIALSQGCDLVAVAVSSAEPIGESAIASAAAFLASPGPMGWLKQALAHP